MKCCENCHYWSRRSKKEFRDCTFVPDKPLIPFAYNLTKWPPDKCPVSSSAGKDCPTWMECL